MKILVMILLLFAVSAQAQECIDPIPDNVICGKLTSDDVDVEMIEIEIARYVCGSDVHVLTTWTGVDGWYWIGGLDNATYIVTPKQEGYIFTPENAMIKEKI